MSNNSNWNAKSLEEKRALLTQLLQKKISAPSLFPLSLGQQALWFLYKLAPTSWAYNTLFTAHTPLGVDIPALRRAFQALIDRHPSLRTTYTVRDRNPLGQIHEQQEIYFKEINAATWSSDELNNYLVQEAQCPFDLEQGPLLRVSLFRTTTNYILMLAIHHIASDFWSLLILIDELGVLYPAQKAGTQAFLPTLNLSYADYVRKQAEMLAGGKGERLWTYWCHQLAGELPVLDLPTDYPRPPVQAYRGASYNFKLSEELTNRLKALAKAEKSTLYTLLLAAFQVLLHRYTSQEDILVGSPTSGRSKPEFSGIVGYFVNLVVLRTDLSGNPTFKTLLRQVRHTVLTALAHQDYPFPLLVERLQPNRDPSRSPIFQVSFALQKPQRVGEIVELFAPSEAGVKYDLGGLELEPFEMAQQEGQFDLTLEMMEARETLFGAFRYNTDLFDSATIARMVGHFQNLLAAIVADPTQKLSDLPLLSVEERQQLLTEWNRTTVNYPQDRCIHQLIEAIVERTPNAIAVVDSYQQLTYQQLNQKANCLAHHLIALGVKPEQLVGICLERSIDLVVGMLAILKAGGAYVPLEPSTPSERLAMMLEDANVALLLTQQHLYSKCSALAMTLVYVDAPSPAIATSSYENPESQVATENLAYAIYTSGSTGKPKAVVVEHRSLLNLVYWHKDAFSLSSGDRASSIASAAFDACGWELWSNLATGASIYIADDVTRSSPEKLQEWLIAKAITIAFVPTPLAESLFALSWSGDCALRVLLTGGDKITQLPRSVPFAIVNNYGPTENTVVTTSVVVTGSFNTVPPIGRPIANTQIYLLDEHLQILPIGVVGEIYIGGNSLARGYLNDPALSAARFIPNPFSNDPGARLYKTGDLARYRSDGNIQFVGRRDNQVKIRGVRIELGEIEAVLSQHPRLQNSIVLVREDIPDNKYLVAYVVANPPAPTSNQLRHFLQQKLPVSMLPSSFILLDSLPLTPNGKVDWRSLPAPEKIAPLQHNFIAAQTPIQQMLVGIWAEVLQVEAVGIDDNFFDLGGHSLLATQIISRVRTNFNVELPLHSLFEFPTVLELAEEIETALRMGQQLPYPQLLPRTGQELAIQLSFAQTRLWFLEQIQPGSGFYNIPVALRLVGSLNLSALESSLNEIIRRHEALRTNFVAESGQPVQVIHHDSSLRLAVVDLRSCDETQRDSHCQRLATQEAMRPFDVERELLVRAIVFQLQRQECVLQLTMHHLVCDGWSMGILVRELASLYESFDRHLPIALLPLPIQYADFALWQRQWLQEEVLEAQLSYWKQQLQDAPALLELPTDRPRPAIGSFRGAHQSFTLSRELSAALNSLSQQQQVTLFMTLLAAFQTLLYRYSGQTDICVGSSIANRHHSQTESSIGLFVNTLVMHTNLSGNPSFQELLGRVREVALGAYAHQDLPFEQLVEALQPERSLSYQPLFQVMFVLQNAPMPALELPGLTLSSWEIDTATAKFDLTLSMSYSSGELVGTLEYNTDLFEADTINRMLGHFQTLLEGIVAHPEQRLADLPLLTLAQRQQLLVECNCTPEGAGIRQANECIHNLFEAQVKRTPEAIAIVFENEQLTYRELNKRANSLAHYLQTLDVKPEVLVGICLERSIEMVVGLLGILKAGGAYVPLDPAYPRDRLAFMLADTQMPVVLTQKHLVEKLHTSSQLIPEHQARVVCIDTDWEAIANCSQENPVGGVSIDNLAYIIYTSGSTGKPKGVAIEHRSTVALLEWARDIFTLEDLAGVLASTSICFDLSVFELFVPLSWGGKIILADNALHLPTLSTANDVTLINTVPSAIVELLRVDGVPSSTRTINLAGEPLHNRLVQQVYQQTSVQQVFNLYGPSENTTYSTFVLVKQGDKIVTIGRPIANTQVYLLDEHLQLLPIGVVGELYIGGAGIARGYLNREQLTTKHFIPNPFSNEPQARLYKTGDLARYLPDGNIQFVGRSDNQVKIRGFRIELGEIEAVLSQHPALQESVVIVREDTPDNKYLVAYVVANQTPSPAIKELHQFLKQKLPAYMIPSAFAILDTLPLTPNGKVDRGHLPTPEITRPKDLPSFVAAQTPIQEMLIGIWAEVLGVQVSIHDNFFKLGGHSLLATQLVSRVRTTLNVELPLRSLFEFPTILELAEEIEKQLRHGQQLPQLELLSRTGQELAIPLSFAQARLWFLEQMQRNSGFYNIPVAVRLQGSLNRSALESGINEVICRHEALRTNFVTQSGQPMQAIASSLHLTLQVVDLRCLTETQRESHCQQLATQEAMRPFNVATEPLVRATLLQLATKEHILLLTMHHLVSDGWSLGVLLREIASLYESFDKHLPVTLPPLPIQYADFTLWQRQWLQGEVLEAQLSYWKQQLKNAPTLLKLPTDRPRPAIQSFRGAHQFFSLSQKLSEAVQKLSQQQQVTLFMTLLAAFQTLLYRYTSQTNILVGTPIANRHHSQIEGSIGLFVNTLVMHTDLGDTPRFVDLLSQVREVAIGAYAHQDLPFEQLVEALQPERSLSHQPLFQVMFVLQNAPMPKLELPGLKVTPLTGENPIAKFDLTLSLEHTDRGLSGVWEYNTDLFDAATIARTARHFENLLFAIVADPTQKLSDLPLLSSSEQQLLRGWNCTDADYPQDKCIHQLVEAAVEPTPDAIALVFENQQITYRELNSRSNKVAHYLQKLGVGSEVIVGICVERSVDFIVGLLGILKAGGAYLPLDPSYPCDRLRFMLEDARVPVLLTHSAAINQSSLEGLRLVVVYLDNDRQVITQQSDENLLNGTRSDNLAYVMYTSGSTGKPKGVAVTHKAVNRLVCNTNYIKLEPSLKIAQISNASFDAATFEIWGALVNGAQLIGLSKELILSPPELARQLRLSKIDVLFLTTALFQQVVKVEPQAFATLKYLLFGGEVADPKTVQQVLEHGAPERLLHMYGPTESTTFTAYYQVQDIIGQQATSLPIGRPIANTQIYLLSEHQKPVPIGVVGELYIGGAGLARGYLNREELTTARFIPNPFSNDSQARLYKTGDLARYLPDGNIQFLGRSDNQVKLRGFRIELGEIEAVLSQHPEIFECVVIARDIHGEQRLVAYIVARSPSIPTNNQLQRFLKQKLPEYMLPSVFVFLDTLPLTPNGKVDRAHLPTPEIVRPEYAAAYVAQTPIQEILVSIWAEVMGIELVGIHDNFFEIGGHSLLATQLISRVREVFSFEIPLRNLFESPTVAEFSKVIDAACQAGEGLSLPAIAPVPRNRDIPLSFAQTRLWFLNQLEGGSAAYNTPVVLRLTGCINVTALEQAIAQIVQRHEVLRTNFPMVDGVPVQVIASGLNVTLALVDLQLPEGERSSLQRLATQEATQLFDLANDPLLRVTLLRLEEQSYVLLLTMHHIISDGWSMGVFIQELSALYQAFSQGAPSPLTPLPLQYADFAATQQQWLTGEVLQTQLNYWQQQLAEAPQLLELPTDRPRPPVQTFRGSIEPFQLNCDLVQKLKKLSQNSGTTLFMTLLAAFVTLLSRYSDREDIVVGSPIANRNRAEIEGLIGFFANTLALRVKVSSNYTFRELLCQVREVTIGAYAHQDLPFEKLVEALQPERALSRNPIVQVVFAFQNAPIPSVDLPGLKLEQLEFDFGLVRFDLELHLREVLDGIDGYLAYSTDLFDACTIQRMAGHFQTLLEGIVADPDLRLWELPLLTQAERQQLLVSSSGDERAIVIDGLSDEEVNALLNQMLAE